MDCQTDYFWYAPLILFSFLENCDVSAKRFLNIHHMFNGDIWVCHSVLMKIQACVVVSSCRRIGGEYSLYFQGKAVQEDCFIPKIQATYSSEKSVSIYQSTRPKRYILHMRLQCLLETFCFLVYLARFPRLPRRKAYVFLCKVTITAVWPSTNFEGVDKISYFPR